MAPQQHDRLCEAAEKAQYLADKLREMYEDALVAPPSKADWLFAEVAANFVRQGIALSQKDYA
jgi:hypothetical protein